MCCSKPSPHILLTNFIFTLPRFLIKLTCAPVKQMCRVFAFRIEAWLLMAAGVCTDHPETEWVTFADHTGYILLTLAWSSECSSTQENCALYSLRVNMLEQKKAWLCAKTLQVFLFQAFLPVVFGILHLFTMEIYKYSVPSRLLTDHLIRMFPK